MMVSLSTYHIPHSVPSAVAGAPAYPKGPTTVSLSDIKTNPHHVDVLTASTGDDTILCDKITLLHLEIRYLPR